MALSAPAGAGMLLAEYRADEQRTVDLSVATLAEEARRPGLENRIFGQTLFGQTLGLGSLWLDYRFGESLSADQGPALALSSTLGQRFQFSSGHSTDVYTGWRLTAPEDPLTGAAVGQRFRGGIGHTLDFLENRAALRLGYEYERGALDALAEDASAHHVGMTGLWRFGRNYAASVGAEYGLLSYPQYAGAGELTGDQLRLHALLQRSFGESLSGRLRYSYADEDFDDPAYSLRRHSLGLDLQYRY